MDGNWERVSYSKKGKQEKLTKSERRRQKESMPTLGDLDPTVRSSAYQFNDSDGDDDFVDQQHNGTQQQQQQPQQQQRSAASGDRKQTGDKKQKRQLSNKEILQELPVSRVQQAYQQSKATIPDSPLAWLVDVCAILDLQLNFDKKEEWNFKDTEFPSKWLNAGCKSFIADALRSVSDEVKQKLLVHGCQRLAQQTERRQCALGTRAVLQLAAADSPQAPVGNHCANRLPPALESAKASPPALTAMLWALCQCAYRCPAAGVAIVANCLLPLLSHKSGSGTVLPLLEDFTQAAVSQQQQQQQQQLPVSVWLRLATGGTAESLSTDCRRRVGNCLRQLQPLVSTTDAGAAVGAFDAAVGGSRDLQQLLLPVVRDSLRARPQQLADLAERLRRGDSGSCGQPAAEIVQFVLGAESPFAASQRRQFAQRLLPHTHRLPLPAAQLVQAHCHVSANAAKAAAATAAGCCAAACRIAAAAFCCCMLATALLLLLASVPPASMPAAVRPVQEYLEQQQVLYHVRRLHSACRQQLNSVLLPFAKRQLEQLEQLYHGRVAPACYRAAAHCGRLYEELAAPHLRAVYAHASRLYFEHAHQRLLHAAVWLRDSTYWAVASIESEMHAYLPDVMEKLGAAANGCLSAIGSGLHFCSDAVKSAVASITG